ncbi:MAG: site-specific integrase, partial [Nitrososphaera sp.]|nr:site-specific integrase [Nitrososphaera sp.]
KALYKRLEKKIIVSGKSTSTLNNYMRCISHLSLHFKCLPTDLDIEQIEEYLLAVKKENRTPSESFFKHTVYGLRFLFRCEGLDDQAIKLPHLKRDNKLPVVLGRSEMKELLKAPVLLKHRVLIGLLYGCGLRCQEARSLLIKDVDFERNMIHVRQSKGRKDRYVPIGTNLTRGLKTYLEAERPHHWLFNGKDHREGFSQKGVQWVVRESTKKTSIQKHVTVHTLRHTYATHLLEEGLDIVSIKELLGHAYIQTTMVYLHVAKAGRQAPFSPLDKLYQKG